MAEKKVWCYTLLFDEQKGSKSTYTWMETRVESPHFVVLTIQSSGLNVDNNVIKAP